ncbi:MAG: FAD-dependent oxidoreductase, partial [Dehalococcoidia bacterium]|nr:FAD-dependent oxidoreductase [Dehalococcoidia bacterium]
STWFNEEAEVFIRQTLAEHGVNFHMGNRAKSVNKEGDRITIHLSDGGVVDADILINTTGVKSRISFLDGSGVKLNHGVVVDRRMRTNLDGIFAAGDVAAAPDFFSDKPGMNVTVASAVSQGRVAGAGMAGVQAEYQGEIPVAALNFFGNAAFSIGLNVPSVDTYKTVKQVDSSGKRFKKLVFSGNILIGGMFVNEKVDPGIVAWLIKKHLDTSPYFGALFDRTQPLSDPWLASLKIAKP